jgi:hypothetical protein
MALAYAEFDSTPQTIVYDIKQAILASSDWSKINTQVNYGNTTVAAAVAATSVTMASTTGITVGSTIRIGPEGGATTEYKTVSAVTATVVTFTGQGLAYAQPIGTTIYSASEILKAMTTRGAAMILDLTDGFAESHNLNMAVWQSHDGTTGSGRSPRWLYWRSAAGVLNQQLHVIVSASKEHLFISVEGPRANEIGATSATLGSLRSYFFFDDVIPYHATDTTPVVFAGGAVTDNATASAANNSHQGNFSRNLANLASWSVAKLLTLDFPSVNSTETIQITRLASGDGKYYLSPYVCFGDESGLRGRLRSFMHAGFTASDTPEIATPPVNQKITYEGQTYKLLAVSKSDGAVVVWGQFGSAVNSSGTTFHRSPVVAVPCTP